MQEEKPATGIMKTGDYGDAIFYNIACSCGNHDDDHTIEVEVDSMNIQVHCYVTVHTKWWEKNRWKQIWDILTKGYTEMQSTLVMNEQTAYNYASVLKESVVKVKEYRNKK